MPSGAWLRRLWQALVAGAALVAIVFGLTYRSWIEAQYRAALVLSVALDAPVISWLARAVSEEPRRSEQRVAGVPTTVLLPAGEGPWPTIVFLNGVTRRGRRHPTVRRLAEGLARAGYRVLVPDPPGLAVGEITPRTVRASIAVSLQAARSRQARRGRVALLGVSAGGSLGLLAAEAPALAGRVTVVGGIAPYTDLREVMLLATTGYHRQGGRLVRYEAKPFMALVIARSLVAALPPGVDRAVLLDRLRGVADDDRRPLHVLRRPLAVPLGREARALLLLLRNRDPGRFDRLFSALSARQRAGIRRLSPLYRARFLRAPLELVTAPHDKYFPPDESRLLVRRAPRARLTVTTTLGHAVPRLSVDDLAGLLRLNGVIVRALHAAG